MKTQLYTRLTWLLYIPAAFKVIGRLIKGEYRRG